MSDIAPSLFQATVELPAAHRPAKLVLHVTAPREAPDPLAVIVFSHGAMLTGRDYAPLLDAWAQLGMVVLAPDHDHTAATPWLDRVLDLRATVDGLYLVEGRCPMLRGRLDPARVQVAGHSFGAHTAAVLLGARPNVVRDLGDDLAGLSLAHQPAGLLLAPPGDGSPGRLTSEWTARAPYLAMDWSGLACPALVVVGKRDNSPMSSIGWRWHADPYLLSPPPKHLLVLREGDHYLGGIVKGRGSDQPSMLQALANITASYLRAPHLSQENSLPADVLWCSRQ